MSAQPGLSSADIERLEKMAALLEKGILTQGEFDAQKAAIRGTTVSAKTGEPYAGGYTAVRPSLIRRLIRRLKTVSTRDVVITIVAVTLTVTAGDQLPQRKWEQTTTSGARRSSAEHNLAVGQAFLAANGKKEGVVTLPSGVQYKPIHSASETAAKPGPTDEVKVHYEGKFLDGTVFDSSFERGVPATFPLNGVIPGWVEALQHMRVGDEWMIYIPSELAYGEHPEQHGAGELPPNSTLTFRVQLLAILPSFGLGGEAERL